MIHEHSTEVISRPNAELLGKGAGVGGDDGETHGHRFRDGDGDAFREGGKEEDVGRGEVFADVAPSAKDADVLVQLADPDLSFERLHLFSIADDEEQEVLADLFEERVDDPRQKERAFLIANAADEGDNGRLGFELEEFGFGGVALAVVGRVERANVDAELDNADARGVEVAVVEEPVSEVGGAGDGAGEVALLNDGVARVAARLPAIVGLVVKVLGKARGSQFGLYSSRRLEFSRR